MDIGRSRNREQDSRVRTSLGHHLGPEPPSPHKVLYPHGKPALPQNPHNPSPRSLPHLSPLAATELHFSSLSLPGHCPHLDRCLKPVGSTSHGPSFLRHLPAYSLLPQRYCPHTPPPPRRRINSWRPTGRCGDLRSWRSLSQVDELGQGGRLSQVLEVGAGEAHIPFCQS